MKRAPKQLTEPSALHSKPFKGPPPTPKPSDPFKGTLKGSLKTAL